MTLQLKLETSPDRKSSERQRIRIPLLDGRVDGELVTFKGLSDSREHLALLLGPWREASAPLVRLHSECLTGDVFGSCKCDCGPQLRESIARISKAGGALLYLRQEGRDIGLYNKIDAYALQGQGHDTFAANRMLSLPEDARDYRFAAEMLAVLGMHRIRLLSNNPDKAAQLERHGISVVERVATGVYLNQTNRPYLEAKVRQSGHFICMEVEESD